MHFTTRRSIVLAAFAAALFVTPTAHAQLAAPDQAGVVQGHIHLAVKDVEAQQKFWTMLGGVPVQNGTLQLIQFPGTFIMLRKGEPAGGTEGSTVEHFGFLVKNLQASLAKWDAAGYKWEKGVRPDGKQGFVTGPDKVKIEIIEDATIDTPVKFHHVHFFTPAPLDTQAWYAKTFGAKAGKRAQFDAADLPGVNLTFSKADTPVVGTKGRSLDHIGFEVKGLEAFVKKLEASGIKMDRPYTKIQNSMTAIAFLTDPWGTYIELTENLAPAK
jgi:catechol 2,3-dioxygenase-like lactoylglutathione lyase family enzyme